MTRLHQVCQTYSNQKPTTCRIFSNTTNFFVDNVNTHSWITNPRRIDQNKYKNKIIVILRFPRVIKNWTNTYFISSNVGNRKSSLYYCDSRSMVAKAKNNTCPKFNFILLKENYLLTHTIDCLVIAVKIKVKSRRVFLKADKCKSSLLRKTSLF